MGKGSRENRSMANAFLLASSLMFLFLFAAINLSSNHIADVLGRILLYLSALLSLLFSFIFFLRTGKINSRIIDIIFAFLIMVLIYIGSALATGANAYALSRSFILICIAAVIYCFYYCGTYGIIKPISKIFSVIAILTLLCLFFAVVSGSGNRQSIVFNNANALGMFSVILFYYSLLFIQNNKYLHHRGFVYALILVLAVFIIRASGSRTALISIILGFLVYNFWSLLSKHRILYLFMVLILLASSYLIIYFFSSAKHSFAATIVEGYMSSFSEKQLFSGRDRMWPTIVQSIFEKPIFGFGAGQNTSDLFNVHYSAHNLYLQVTFETGIFGLILLITNILIVFLLIYKARNTSHSRLLISFFVSMLFIQNFEITLFQNNMALGFPFWVLFGLIMGESVRAQRQKAFYKQEKPV